MVNNEHSKLLTVKAWTLFTSAGWFVGFVFILLLGLPYEALGIGGQSSVGIGMGTGVGLVQALLLRRYGVSGKWWFLTSCIGMSIPYMIYDLMAVSINLRPEQVLPAATAIGSLIVGWLQYQFILRPISTKTLSWIFLTCAGWTITHVLLGLVDYRAMTRLGLPVFFNVLFVLICILGGGPVLITSRKIVSVLNRT
jgi:hypothetical protein